MKFAEKKYLSLVLGVVSLVLLLIVATLILNKDYMTMIADSSLLRVILLFCAILGIGAGIASMVMLSRLEPSVLKTANRVTDTYAPLRSEIKVSKEIPIQVAAEKSKELPAQVKKEGSKEFDDMSPELRQAYMEKIEEQVNSMISEVLGTFEGVSQSTAAQTEDLKTQHQEIGQIDTSDDLENVKHKMQSKLTQIIENSQKHQKEISSYREKIIEQQKKIEEFRKESEIDGLTGIFNRRAFDRKLKEEMERSSRHGNPLCLIIMDLDKFKSLNDTHGHVAGDRFLKAFAKIVGSVKRELDILSRYGGEEFVLILPETDIDGAMAIAERVRTTINQIVFRMEGKAVSITASYGVSKYFQGEESSKFIERSDTALYRAKEGGRNRAELELAPGQNAHVKS